MNGDVHCAGAHLAVVVEILRLPEGLEIGVIASDVEIGGRASGAAGVVRRTLEVAVAQGALREGPRDTHEGLLVRQAARWRGLRVGDDALLHS